ncbi:DUF3566 domain-containing protein [Streptomyces alboflavus]|uniref:DUF3566 domain-containing protein n=1 Tax=Streptomyces alboflavus TaxID=67267 RepID=UPI000B4282F1|nr:DUF3566 domain-containing protein [Streptomyces alboflavus]
MSGATGAGSAGTSGTGTEGARGSATDAPDSHESHGSQGGTVTDTRGRTGTDTDSGGAGKRAGGHAGDRASGSGAAGTRAGDGASGALPGERQPQQNNQPYHPPAAYQPAPAGAVRRPRTGARTTPRTRKARLRVAKADPWSVMKVSFLLSIALGICTIVAAAVLWMVMDAMGVFSTVGGTISEATGSNESNGFDLQAFLSLPRVLIFTSIIAVIDVVLATALATLGAFIYNLSAGFVGGVELTLAEDE